MEDSQIIQLYFNRDEKAIKETENKYGKLCFGLAYNILSIKEDAEECVSDTYLKAWETIPPLKPSKLGYYLGKITRNIAINLWRKNHTQKRYSGMDVLLDELEDCIPTSETVEDIIGENELSALINQWLKTLTSEDRQLFVCRYWYGDDITKLSKDTSLSNKQVTKRLFLLRQKLKKLIESEGYTL